MLCKISFYLEIRPICVLLYRFVYYQIPYPSFHLLQPQQLLNEFKGYRRFLFESHAKYILGRFLNPWVDKINPSSLSRFPIPSKDLSCLIVDNRPNEMLRFSVLNTLLMTRLRIPIKIYTTNKSYLETKHLFSDLLEKSSLIEINTLDIDEININSYNNLFKSCDFWESLECEKTLVFQTDSAIIKPLDFSFFNYDYIGALFSKGKSRSRRFPRFNNDLSDEIGSIWITQCYNVDLDDNIFVGNGGLSIRNAHIMKKICLKEISSSDENEDVFFSRLITKYSKHIPKFDDAKNFAIEADYHESIGFHGSYLYLDASELSLIYDLHIRNIIGLISSF